MTNIPNKIGVFLRDTHKPTTMKYGTYYVHRFKLPFAPDNRAIRVWLPEDYDFSNPSKRFPVMYMSDGQNLVDEHLTAYGDWKLDKTIHSLYKNEHLPSCILVGIDCPNDPDRRGNELNPPYYGTTKMPYPPHYPYGNCIVDYIADTLKPLIDKLFFTIPDREHTAVGGSSMGGIFAFYAYHYRYDTFGFTLSFSPAFFFYTKKEWYRILNELDVPHHQDGKIFLYVGGVDFEARFVKRTFDTYDYLLKNGYTHDNVSLLFDSSELHHESAWAIYSPNAFRFWLKDLK